METILDTPKQVTIVEAQIATITKISEPQVIYSNEAKECRVIYSVYSTVKAPIAQEGEDQLPDTYKWEGSQDKIIWSGDDYIAAGQFTDADVKNRILELL